MSELRDIVNLIGTIFHHIWSYDIITVAGNHIRLGNIVFAILLSIGGIKYSKNFSAYIKKYVRSSIDSDKDAAQAIEKIVLYIAFILYIITILEIANVPLSTFAFIGGALAIGIGLGAQTLIGNFISSIIIMVERPMKIGDLVEIEGVIGRVTSVGARCVVLTTRANVDVLVPNSKLMQNTLVNWTLSDNKVRYQVEVCIQRKSSINLNPTTLIPVFHQAMVNQEFVASEYDPEIFLIKIDENNFTFLLAFYCNLDDIHSPEYMQSTINISLFENLKGFQFSVDFPKLVDVKPTAEKADKA